MKDIQIFIDLQKIANISGVLPGSEVKFYRLERCVSLSQGRVYCQWKMVSNVEIVFYCHCKYVGSNR